jgi:diaminopimelate dehydrogenase
MRIAVIGYGNTGKYAVEAVTAAEDMELAGVVWRRAGQDMPRELSGIKTVREIDELGKVDTALLCVPTRKMEEMAMPLLARGINTVDSFDAHAQIVQLRARLDKKAKEHNAIAVTAAGWDPGSDSVIRVLLQAIAPRGITYTDFGPGMSMGHTVAAKAAEGVADALSVTIPLGTSIHRRNVYVQLKEGAEFSQVEAQIKNDPYFIHDETHVYQVPDVSAITDRGSGVRISRKAAAGNVDNQLFTYEMRIHNPALTAQVMTACARAAARQKPGAYTMAEIPVIDLLPGAREDNIRALV